MGAFSSICCPALAGRALCLWQVLIESKSTGMHRHDRYFDIADFYANFVKGLSEFHYEPYWQGAYKSTMKCILCSHFHTNIS